MSKTPFFLIAILFCLCVPLMALHGRTLDVNVEEDHLLRYWRSIDADGDGHATKAELQWFFSKVFNHLVSDEPVRSQTPFRGSKESSHPPLPSSGSLSASRLPFSNEPSSLLSILGFQGDIEA